MGMISPVSVRLADGACLRLFSPTLDDAERALTFFQRASATTNTILSSPEDAAETTIEQEKQFITNAIEHPCGLFIGAEQFEGGPIVALCDLRGKHFRRARHGVDLGILVDEPWRGRGLGRAMLTTAMEWARSNPEIRRISLAVLAENHGARRLYESLGFVQDGVTAEFTRSEDGTYHDQITMSLHLRSQPARMHAPGAGISVEWIRRLIDHERWATETLLAALDSVPPEKRDDPSYQRAIDKLGHIAAARALWLQRLGGDSPTPGEVFPKGLDLASVQRDLEAVQRAWEQWGSRITDAILAEHLNYASRDGTHWRNTYAEIVLHVCTHSFLHRGQANTLLAQAGCTPVNMDLIFFTRSQL